MSLSRWQKLMAARIEKVVRPAVCAGLRVAVVSLKKGSQGDFSMCRIWTRNPISQMGRRRADGWAKIHSPTDQWKGKAMASSRVSQVVPGSTFIYSTSLRVRHPSVDPALLTKTLHLQ